MNSLGVWSFSALSVVWSLEICFSLSAMALLQKSSTHELFLQSDEINTQVSLYHSIQPGTVVAFGLCNAGCGPASAFHISVPAARYATVSQEKNRLSYDVRAKTYNRRDSQMVTHSSTSRPVQCLCMAERTGCPVLTDLWSYV